jgi:hypothetical protein
MLSGRSGLDVSKGIKAINPSTEIIMHTSDDEVIAGVEAYCKAHEQMFPGKKDGSLN